MDAPRQNPPGIGELLKGPVVPNIPTRRLDLPRDFWERWGELRASLEGDSIVRLDSQHTLMDSLERDLKEMLDAQD